MTINLGVVRGTCSDAPDVRELTSGRRLATVSVRVKTGEEPATSVPVTIWDPPGWVETIEAGEELLVVGRVQRRFYRSAAGATAAKVIVSALSGKSMSWSAIASEPDTVSRDGSPNSPRWR